MDADRIMPTEAMRDHMRDYTTGKVFVWQERPIMTPEQFDAAWEKVAAAPFTRAEWIAAASAAKQAA